MKVKKVSSQVRRGNIRPAFALSVLTAAMLPIMAAAEPGNYDGRYSYVGDPGWIATNPGELAAAKASWETNEYGNFLGRVSGSAAINAPWQLTAINASSAYALGYFGQGVTLGMMDSGYRATHQAFQTDRIQSVRASGVYGTSGYGYRSATPANPFVKGDPFTVGGDEARTSDYSHGTGMLGVVSGLRDNLSNQQGISFGSDIWVAKTGGSDTQSHGPFHDYVYWYTANKALVDAGAQVINSSWGSFVQTLDRRSFNGQGVNVGVGNAGMYEVTGRDGNANNNVTVLPNEFMKDLEYQYLFSKKTYSEGGIQYNPDYPGQSFLDAIWAAIKDTGTVNVRSAGNNDWDNPFLRPAYPLFNPWAENQWVAVGGVQPPSAANPEYSKNFGFNEAGLAKWWTVSTPSNSVWTTSSGSDTAYSGSSGTSPATPVATAAMGVLLSRYQNMNAMQVRELMFTTANNKMTDGVTFLGTGQTSTSGASIAWTAPDGLPDVRWGWGIPDLDKGMHGPGQFLSPMVYNMDKAPLDVWSNNISQVAIKAREQEDLAWLAGYKAQGIDFAGEYSPNVLNPDGTMKPEAFMMQGILNDPLIQAAQAAKGEPTYMYDKISYEDAQKWRKEWMDEQAAYIQYKIDNNLYTASLTKQGPGRLVMTGDNTYEGGTTVQAGELYGFTESFGTGTVVVDGGRFGVLSSYNDLFTMKGVLNSTASRKANVTVNNGGTFMILAGNDVSVGALDFNDGAQITVGHIDRDVVQEAFQNGQISTGTITATSVEGFSNDKVVPNYAFIDHTVSLQGTVLTGALSPNNLTYADYGTQENGRSIGATLDTAWQAYQNSGSTAAPGGLLGALDYYTVTRGPLTSTLDSLGSDFYLNADSASIVNAVSVTQHVKNQALGLGSGRTAKLGGNGRLWATVAGNWSTTDFGYSDMDGRFNAGLVGAEVDVASNHTVGVFIGAGSSEFRGGRYGKIESNDMHGGVYGIYRGDIATINYGLTYSQQDRDATRTLIAGDFSEMNKVSPDASVIQLFAEAAYTGLNTQSYSIEPYAGLNLIHAKTDSYTERVGPMSFRTQADSQSLQAGTLGVRGGIPLGDSVALKGDLSVIHFFGDNRPEANMLLDNAGTAKIRGGKLGTLASVGLGLEASLGKATKLSVSYRGAFNSDIKSNGLFANLGIRF